MRREMFSHLQRFHHATQRTKNKNMADGQNDTHTEIEQCKDLSRVEDKEAFALVGNTYYF